MAENLTMNGTSNAAGNLLMFVFLSSKGIPWHDNKFEKGDNPCWSQHGEVRLRHLADELGRSLSAILARPRPRTVQISSLMIGKLNHAKGVATPTLRRQATTMTR